MSLIKFNKMSPCYQYRGFTLTEVLISFSILGLLVVFFGDFLQQSFRVQTFVFEQSAAINEAQKGMEVIIEELREAASADSGAYLIDSISDNEIIFYSDIDTDVYSERVRYFLDGNSIKKGIIEPTGDPLAYTGTESISTLCDYIINTEPVFQFYNENYPIDAINNPLTYPVDVTEISLIKIKLDVNVNPARIPDTYTLESFAQIRNVKQNL